MKFTLNNTEYHIRFYRSLKDLQLRRGKKMVTFNTVCTECKVVVPDGNDGKTVAYSSAQCSPKDRFVKDIGRRVTINRMVNDLNNSGQNDLAAAVQRTYDNRRQMAMKAV